MTQFMALELTITAENADEVIAKLKALGATARGEAREGVSALDTAVDSLKDALGELGIALGVAEALHKFYEAANEGELATNRLSSAFSNLGLNVANFTSAIDRAEAPILKFGQFTQSQLNLALGDLIQRTTDVRGSLEHMNIVAGLAASGQYDLHSASLLVARAMEGQWIMLNRQFPSLKMVTDKWGELNRITESFLKDQANTLSGQLARVGTELAKIAEHTVELMGGSSNLATAMDKLIARLDWLDKHLPDIAIGFERMFKPVALLADLILHPVESLKQMGVALKDIFTGNVADLLGQTPPSGAHRLPAVNIGPNAATQLAPPGSFLNSGPGLLTPFGTGELGRPEHYIGGGIPAPMDIIKDLFSQQVNSMTGLGATGGQTNEDSNTRMKELLDLWTKYQRQVELSKNITQQMTQDIADAWQTMAQSMAQAFENAFHGKKIGAVFKELGESILAGLGNIFEQQGESLLAYGLIMLNLMPALTNPFTAGPAAVAAGIALMALGAAFKAAASPGGSGGGGGYGGVFSTGGSTAGVSSTQYIMPQPGQPFAAGHPYPGGPIQPNITVIGTNDPSAMQQFRQFMANMQRRGFLAPGTVT